jgi:hypothetical protein
MVNALRATKLQVVTSSGGLTKFNRSHWGAPKTHALDAACVGQVEALRHWNMATLTVKAMGRGSHQRTRLTKYGFPRGHPMCSKRVHGFATGDLISACVAAGKKAGRYVGRVAVRACGFFNIQGSEGIIQGISHRHCRLIQRNDGYVYHYTPATISDPVTSAKNPKCTMLRIRRSTSPA